MAKSSGGTRYKSPRTSVRRATGASFSPSEEGKLKAAQRGNVMFLNLNSFANETGARVNNIGRSITYDYNNGNVAHASIEVKESLTKNGKPKVSYQTSITGHKVIDDPKYRQKVNETKTYNSLETAYRGLKRQVKQANKF